MQELTIETVIKMAEALARLMSTDEVEIKVESVRRKTDEN